VKAGEGGDDLSTHEYKQWDLGLIQIFATFKSDSTLKHNSISTSVPLLTSHFRTKVIPIRRIIPGSFAKRAGVLYCSMACAASNRYTPSHRP
jgi:hypothetical protein